MYSVGTLFTGLYFPDSPGTLYSKEEQVYIFLILQVFFTARKNRFIFLDSPVLFTVRKNRLTFSRFSRHSLKLGRTSLYFPILQVLFTEFLILYALFTARKSTFIFS